MLNGANRILEFGREVTLSSGGMNAKETGHPPRDSGVCLLDALQLCLEREWICLTRIS